MFIYIQKKSYVLCHISPVICHLSHVKNCLNLQKKKGFHLGHFSDKFFSPKSPAFLGSNRWQRGQTHRQRFSLSISPKHSPNFSSVFCPTFSPKLSPNFSSTPPPTILLHFFCQHSLIIIVLWYEMFSIPLLDRFININVFLVLNSFRWSSSLKMVHANIPDVTLVNETILLS